MAPKPVAPFRIIHPVRQERYLNMCVYGEYGVGKTHFAATAEDVPSMRDVLFIDAESGDLTLQSRPSLDVIRIDKYSQLARIYEFLRLHTQYRDADDSDKLIELQSRVMRKEETRVRRYKTVIIDSLSEIFKYSMMQVTGIQLGKQTLDIEPDQPGFGEWGKTTEMIRLLVRSLRDLPLNVILVCSEKSTEDKNKRATVGLNLPRALAAEIPGFLDVVGYLAAAAVGGDKQNPSIERRLYMQAGHGFLAKSRLPLKEPYLEDPTMTKLEGLIKKESSNA